MPTYVYETLPQAGQAVQTFEFEQRMSDPPFTRHPETGVPLKRVLAPTFIGGKYARGSAAPCGMPEPIAAGCGAGACGRCVS